MPRSEEEIRVPERTAAINNLAQAIADQKVAVEETPVAIRQLAESIDRDSAGRRKVIVGLFAGVGILTVLVILVIVLILSTRSVLHTIQKATGSEAQERSKKSVQTILDSIRTENERTNQASNQALLDEVARLLGKPAPVLPPITYPPPTTTTTTTTTVKAQAQRPATPATAPRTTSSPTTASTAPPTTTQAPATTTTTTRRCAVQSNGVCITTP
jgi:type II secretory pathway pseudopilin PulG